MHILHILSDDIWGGAEAQVAILLRGLKEANTQVSLITLNNNRLAAEARRLQVAVTVASEEGSRFACIKKAASEIGTISPDIVVSHGYKEAVIGAQASRKYGIPWVHVFHGISERHTGFKYVKNFLYKLIERALCRRFGSHTIFVSEDARNRVGFETSAASTVVSNAFVPDEQSIKASDRESARSTPFSILWIGRFVTVKRPDVAVRTALTLCTHTEQPFFLDMVGDGHLFGETQELAKRSGIFDCIRFHGFQPDLSGLYKNASALLITSDSEGLPSVLLEAAQFGLPVISTAVGGIPAFKNKLTEYPIFLAPAGDVEELAQHLASVLVDPVKYIQCANSCDLTYYSYKRMTQEHLMIYKTILDNSCSN